MSFKPAQSNSIGISGGIKYDSDKPRLDLIDPDAIEGLARVLEFGAKKYEVYNWRKGMAYSRLIAAALRHLFEIMRGNNIDQESGYPHVDHLGCCWMFLSYMMKKRRDLDDRYNSPDLKAHQAQQKNSLLDDLTKAYTLLKVGGNGA